MSYEIVKQMIASKPILQGTSTVMLPGGKRSLNVQTSEGTTSGICHQMMIPSGITATRLVASGANTNWGRSGIIAAYPQYYTS